MRAPRPDLSKHVKTAVLGLFDQVPERPLQDATIRQIVATKSVRVSPSHGPTFDWEAVLMETIAARRTESSSDARGIETSFSRALLAEMSAEIISRPAKRLQLCRVPIGLMTDASFSYLVDAA